LTDPHHIDPFLTISIRQDPFFMATDSVAVARTDDPPGQAAPRESGRIGALDVLRGIALLGMFLVHFNNNSSTGTGLAGVYQKIVELFFDERFWTMFGILFGIGFAIQFRRADARGEPYTAKYLRRMAGLAVFGFIAHAVFGFNVLLGYAIWGVPLILFRKWSTPALIVALVMSATSGAVYQITRATYGVATEGEKAYRAERAAVATENRAFNEANIKARNAKSYPDVFVARLHHMRWFYVQWFSFLPVNALTLFLLGVLGLRLGIFDHPEEHRRLIVSLMIFGAASWALSLWLWSLPNANPASPYLRGVALNQFSDGYGLIRGPWLAFTYIGAVLLLVAHDQAWLRRLSAFGWTGRMALTNYMIQIAILDLAFAPYALGLTVSPLVGLAAAIALFLVDAAFSKWWLARYRYGPLEWLWRSITYARWQPLAFGASHAEAIPRTV
jgi:uncharacterized protein